MLLTSIDFCVVCDAVFKLSEMLSHAGLVHNSLFTAQQRSSSSGINRGLNSATNYCDLSVFFL